MSNKTKLKKKIFGSSIIILQDTNEQLTKRLEFHLKKNKELLNEIAGLKNQIAELEKKIAEYQAKSL